VPPVAFFAAAGALILIAIVAAAAVLIGQHRHHQAGLSGPPAAGEGPAPSAYSKASSTSAFDEITTRVQDAKPLTKAETFSPKTITDADSKATLKLVRSSLDARCTTAIWGAQLAEVLQRGGCAQAARAAYTDKHFVAMVTIFNLVDVKAADAVVADADPKSGNGFPLALDGVPLGQGFSTARGVAMGHYAVITWVQRVDGSGDEQDTDLLSLLVATGRPKAVLVRAIGDSGHD
jgi:hypothetical protein